MSRAARLCFVVALSAFTATAAVGCSSNGVFQNTSPGQAVPVVTKGWSKVTPISVQLPTSDPVTDGASVPADSAPLLVNIWASWCEPCKKELPLLQKVASTGKLNVIGFSRDRDKASAAGALKAAGVTYSNWLDSDASLGVELDNRVPLSSVPSSVLIRNGKVIAVHIGEFTSKAEILQALEQK